MGGTKKKKVALKKYHLPDVWYANSPVQNLVQFTLI